LQGWLFHVPYNNFDKYPTVIYFHGNAGNISNRMDIVFNIVQEVYCNCLIVSYRGYGLSHGEPSEEGFKKDAEAALAYIKSRAKYKDTPIIIFGSSIGGAVAIDLASKNNENISALIVENTFTCITELIGKLFPPLAYFYYLSFNRWNSFEMIKKVNVPILFLSGSQDEMIPPLMMSILYETATTSKKVLRSIEGGTHNDTFTRPNFFMEIKDFLNSIEI